MRAKARRRRAVLQGGGLALLVAAWPRPAEATWSIVAVDPNTQEVGAAVASCVEAPFGTTLLPQVTALAPGIGAIAAQAQFSQQTRDLALDLLLMGSSPQEVIDMVVAADGLSASRQYGVVDLTLASAGFTGDGAMDWAGHQPAVGVSAQGNILYGPEVVGDALAAYEAAAPSCPWTLADRLLVALEAGSAQGGDNRCSEEQSALAATLMVALPGDAVDAPSLDLRIASQPMGGDNPVALLRVAYEEWRIEHPADDTACGSGSGSGSGSGTGAGSGTGSGSAGTTGTPAPADGTSSGTPPAPSDDDGPPPMPATGTGAPDTTQASGDETGCGCGASPPPRGPVALFGCWVLALHRRRARRGRA